jgi:hypothetical protein
MAVTELAGFPAEKSKRGPSDKSRNAGVEPDLAEGNLAGRSEGRRQRGLVRGENEPAVPSPE